jgi:hypothetical protein
MYSAYHINHVGHRVDGVTPIEKTVEAMAQLVK